MVIIQFLVTLQKKTKIFHDFYSRQCQTISNISILQLTLLLETANHLSIADSKTDTIFKVIQILNQNKAHEQDDISFKLLKLCGLSILKSLYLPFDNCVRRGVFPNIWEMVSVPPLND